LAESNAQCDRRAFVEILTMLDKEGYRRLIETYLGSYATGDFAKVYFSTRVQFLSPTSDVPINGRENVVRFVTGLSKHVSAVNIVSTAVDFPTASGVWQATTTRGVQYTLHDFFQLDGEGLAYIWPMFDPKAVIADPQGLLQWLRGAGGSETSFSKDPRTMEEVINETIPASSRSLSALKNLGMLVTLLVLLAALIFVATM
jgi:hypothetical protein